MIKLKLDNWHLFNAWRYDKLYFAPQFRRVIISDSCRPRLKCSTSVHKLYVIILLRYRAIWSVSRFWWSLVIITQPRAACRQASAACSVSDSTIGVHSDSRICAPGIVEPKLSSSTAEASLITPLLEMVTKRLSNLTQRQKLIIEVTRV